MSLRAWPSRLVPIGSRHRLVWALWLALLLPLAQTAAAAHVVIHHGTAQSRDGAPAGLFDAPCVQCMLAAPLGAGALPCAPAPVLVPPGPQAVPAVPALPAPASALALAYRSRAPPLSLH